MNTRTAMTMCAFALLMINTATAEDLESYRKKYDNGLTKIMADYQNRIDDITKSYSSGLNTVKARVQAAGNLDKLKAVMEEISRFQMAKALPAEEDKPIPEVLALVEDCQSNIAEANSAKAQRIVTLASQYDKALLRLQTEHTRKGEIDKATAIQEERRALAATDTLTAARDMLNNNTDIPPKRSMPTPSAQASPSRERVLTVKTYIDGFDTLRFKANKAWFTHHSKGLPGRHGGNNYPTHVDEAEWTPKWKGSTSEPYMSIRPPLPRRPAQRASVELVKARGTVKITEKPSQENDYTLSVHFADPAGGADWYEIKIRIEY